jgi:ATP-dependent RNA helicase DeaD
VPGKESMIHDEPSAAPSGGPIPSDETWCSLGVGEDIRRSLERAGISRPMPVQSAAFPAIREGRSAILRSGTGTGKTLAYLLPLFERLRSAGDGAKDRRVLILAPAPELAMQIFRVAESHVPAGVRPASLIGSGNPERQIEKLRARPTLLVGTPGRVFELIARRKLAANSIATLVLDEGDRILSPENDLLLRDLLSRPECAPQIVIASATIGERAVGIFERFGSRRSSPAGAIEGAERLEPVRIEIADASLSGAMRHHVHVVPAEHKDAVLARFLSARRRARSLVFVSDIRAVPRVIERLARRNIRSEGISSSHGKERRRASVASFASGEVHVLVSTDALARGLDFEHVDWVIHFDPARDSETYLHRSGRTARAGREGDVLSLLSPKEAFLAKRYSEDLGIELREFDEPRPIHGDPHAPDIDRATQGRGAGRERQASAPAKGRPKEKRSAGGTKPQSDTASSARPSRRKVADPGTRRPQGKRSSKGTGRPGGDAVSSPPSPPEP